MKKTAVFEVKQVAKGSKFYYNSGSFPKQILNLRAAKTNKLWWKYPDTSLSGTPWDVSIFYRVPAYLVIFFDKDFYVIDIDDVFKEIETGSKGLVEEKANDICKYKDHL